MNFTFFRRSICLSLIILQFVAIFMLPIYLEKNVCFTGGRRERGRGGGGGQEDFSGMVTNIIATVKND